MVKTSGIPKLWRKRFALLPAYDPCRDAGESVFDASLADYYIEFIETCCVYSGGSKAGEPLILEEWQRALVGCLFGWRKPDGARRYREGLLYIPRGNGKSELLAAIICAVLFLDEAPGAQLYSAAAKRDQTRFVFDPVRRMIGACPEMESRAEVFKTSIVVGDKSYRTISREATTEHGGNTYFAAIDELHAQPDRELVDVLKTSSAKHPRSLLFYATTADYVRESICNEKYGYAIKVRDGAVSDPSFFPIIFEAGRRDNWRSPKVWRKANPNLDVSIMESDIAALCKQAVESPGFENTFKRLHLNMQTESVSRWISSELWTGGEDRGLTLEAFRGQRCWGGLDLSALSDLTAFVLAFRRGEEVCVFPFFWCPSSSAERRERLFRLPYPTWERQGFLRYTPGNEIDYDFIRRDINEVVSQYDLSVSEIAIDRLFQGVDLSRRLAEEDGFTVVDHGQGFKDMAVPTRETERLLLGGKLRHPNNPVLNWMASNVVIQQDAAGNSKPAKNRSSEKIDGIVAMIMGVGRALVGEVAPEAAPSFASTGGIRCL